VLGATVLPRPNTSREPITGASNDPIGASREPGAKTSSEPSIGASSEPGASNEPGGGALSREPPDMGGGARGTAVRRAVATNASGRCACGWTDAR